MPTAVPASGGEHEGGAHGIASGHGTPGGRARKGRAPARAARAERAQTRARIAEVALELFADQGFSATSTREISERLGFTKAALYYHFRTKDDLLAAIVAPVLDELSALVARAGDQGAHGARATARREVAEGYVDIVARHAHLIRVVADDPSARKSDALLAARPLFERLVPLLAGKEAPSVAERTRVVAALGAVHGAFVHARPGDDPAVVRAAALDAACGALGLGTSGGGSRRPAGRRTSAGG